MLKSNRGLIMAAVGWLIAVPCLWLLITDFASVSRSYESRAASASDYYAWQAEREISESCPGLAPKLQKDCVSNAEATARENQRSEQDLAAQKVTAWWTQIMGGAALVGMALSALGVALVWTTFREQRRTNEIAVDGYEAENRPVLILEFSKFTGAPLDNIGWWKSPVLLNVGKGPALIEQVDIECHAVPPAYTGSLQQLCDREIRAEIKNDVVGAGASYTCDPVVIKTAQFTINHGNVTDFKQGVYLSVIVKYRRAIGTSSTVYTTHVIARCLIRASVVIDGNTHFAMFTNSLPQPDEGIIVGLDLESVADGTRLT